MNSEFIKLLEIEYDELKYGLEKASIEGKGTPQEIADRREALFHSFFEKYFPFPYRITKGNIVDSFNRRSPSIDCVILDPSHPNTIDKKNNKSSIIFADGVDYAIEIKGDLKSEKEIKRALEQIKKLKELTRINPESLIEKDKNEYCHKIPTILFADKTYSDIGELIDKIVSYYRENHIKRIFQFDIMIAGEYTIINSCKGQISLKNHERGLFFEKTGKRTLAVLLYLMSNMPLVQHPLSKPIYNLYLDKVFYSASFNEEWNKILQEIEDE